MHLAFKIEIFEEKKRLFYYVFIFNSLIENPVNSDNSCNN